MQSSGGMATVEAATAAARQPAHVGPGGRPDRRHLGGQDGRLRERRHARHGRHLGRHRRRGRRAAAHAPPARHEGRRLPGDGADGRHRHDRRGRRLDRLRRPRRRLPRRARSRPGADPGPACYGRGGTEPTSTDAQLVLGRLRPTAACSAGACSSTSSSREQAMATVADPLGMTVEEAALGALQIQKYGMTQAIELNSVRRGYDPREFTLVAAGGAGPLFACDIALELEIPRVLVPPHPGITRRPACSPRTCSTSSSPPSATAAKRSTASGSSARYAELVAQAVAQLDADGVAGGPAARPAPRRLPLRRPGLRGALRRARRARSTTPGSTRSRRRSTRAHEARVRAALRRARSRSSTSASLGDRPRRRSSSGRSSRPATAIRRGRGRSSARSSSRSTAAPSVAPTPFYERELLRAGDRIEGPAIDRAVRLDDGRPAGPDGRDRPLRQHRHRLHHAARRPTRRAGPAWRRRSSCA